jgi:hypothetical protein
MGQAEPLVGALSDHLARIVDDHGANPRVGVGAMWSGELDRPPHVTDVPRLAIRHYVERRSMR